MQRNGTSFGTPGAEYAAAWLANVADRVEQAKIEALLGINYDADGYDALVHEYRRARQYAESVRRAAVQLTSFAVPAASTQPGLAA